MKQELAIVVASAPARGDFARAAALARAARRRGLEVSLFLMDAAVVHGGEAAAAALVEDGCEVVLCGTNAAAHAVVAAPGVVVGSQDDHAAMVTRAAHVLAFA